MIENTEKAARDFLRKAKLEHKWIHNKEISDINSGYIAEVMVLYAAELLKPKTHPDIKP
jgi:hypothetical protein